MANLNGHEGGNAGHGQGMPKEPGEGGKPHAEGVEGRGQAKGNASLHTTPRTQSREGVYTTRIRIGHAAADRRVSLRPEAGAQCGNTARWDLRGGRRATGVPTANELTTSVPLIIGNEKSYGDSSV
jgi:hypothetical protein